MILDQIVSISSFSYKIMFKTKIRKCLKLSNKLQGKWNNANPS